MRGRVFLFILLVSSLPAAAFAETAPASADVASIAENGDARAPEDLRAVYGNENIPDEMTEAQRAAEANKPRDPAGLPQLEGTAGTPTLGIVGIEDHETLIAEGTGPTPLSGQVFALRSKSAEPSIIGFAEVLEVRPPVNGRYQVRARVLRLSQKFLVQSGDQLIQLDLRTSQPIYRGHTEMLVRDRWKDVSARFRPLYIQGFSIGETAALLGKDEVLVSMYGHVSYGLFERVSVGTFLPGYFLKSPNGNLKTRLYANDSDTVSMGLSFTKTKDSDLTAVNLTLYWDSVTSDHMISHTLATFAVATLQNVEDTVAIKTAGTSSLQTGYELLLNNWDRVLFGPSYNFETKSIGGYLAYKRIWDRFHLSGSLSTVDVRELKLDPRTGYVALVEGYWRF